MKGTSINIEDVNDSYSPDCACAMIKFLTPKTYGLVYINEALKQLLGYNFNELSNKGILSLLDIVVGSEEYLKLENDLKLNRPFKKHQQILTKLGDKLECNIEISQSQKSENDSDNIVAILNFQPEEISLEEKQKMQMNVVTDISKILTIGAWEYDLETKMEICSQAVIDIREDSPENSFMPTDYSLQFYPEGFRDHVSIYIKETIETGKEFELVTKFVSLKGNNKWVKIKAIPKYKDGKVFKILGTLEDVTLEVNNNNLIQETKRKLENFKYALDSSSIVAITDLEGKITYVNGNFCRVSGYEVEELIGKGHNIIGSGYHDKFFFGKLWSTISSGKVWRGEIKNKRKDGSFYWVDTYIVPLMGDNNKPEQYLSIRHDITTRKEQEFQIKKSLEEKEILVDEIHHRVKNSLQIVSSLLTLMENTKESIPSAYFDDMKNRIQAMSLIHDTIYETKNYNRINAKIYLNFILTNLQNSLSSQGIKAITFVDENMEFGVGTATNVGIIITEAINNVAKHAFKDKEEGREVEIRLSSVKDKVGYYDLLIKDNGSGIDLEILNNLDENGSLGLTLIKGLAEQMQGKTDISNNSGCTIDVQFFDNLKS